MPAIRNSADTANLSTSSDQLDVIEALITDREAYLVDTADRCSIGVSGFPNFIWTCIRKINALVALKLSKSHIEISRSGDRLIINTGDNVYKMTKPRGRRGEFLSCEPGTQAVARCCLMLGIARLESDENVKLLANVRQTFDLTSGVNTLFMNEVELIMGHWLIGVPDPKMSGVTRKTIWVSSDLSQQIHKLADRMGLKYNILSIYAMALALEDQVELKGYRSDLKTASKLFNGKIQIRLGLAEHLQQFMEKGKDVKRGMTRGGGRSRVAAKRVSRTRRRRK